MKWTRTTVFPPVATPGAGSRAVGKKAEGNLSEACGCSKDNHLSTGWRKLYYE